MLRFIRQKLVHKKWMVICLLIGNVLLIGIAGSNPMYQGAALKRALDSKLADMIIEENKNPGAITFSASVQKENNQQGTVYSQVQQMSENLSGNLDVEQVYNVRYHALSKMRASILTKREESKNTKEMQICALSEFQDHTKILSGEMYSGEPDASGAYGAVVSQKAMTRLDLLLGDEFEFPWVLIDGKPVRIKIVGVFENSEPDDSYWVKSPSDYFSHCFIDDKLFQNTFIRTENPSITFSTQWFLLFDYKQLVPGQVDALISEIERLSVAYTSKSSKFPHPDVLSFLREYQVSSKKTVATLLILQVPVLALLLAFIFMISRQMLDLEQNEIALLKSRGSGKNQILTIYLLQSVILSGISLVIGLPISIFLCQALGSANGFLEFIQRKAIQITISPQVFYYLIGAVLCSIACMVLPVLKEIQFSIVAVKQNKGRKKRHILQRVYADVLLLVLSIYGLYSFSTQSELLVARMLQGESLDPFLFLCSSLFIVSAGFVFLRIQPWIVRLIFIIGRRFWKPAFFASFLQIIRAQGKQSFMMIFLILTLALGIFNATVARTILSNSEKAIRYEQGTDLVLREVWEDNSVYLSNNPDMELIYYEPDFGKFQTLEGAENVAKVRMESEIEVSGQKDILADIMAIDTKEFGDTIRFQDGLLPTHINHYLNVLGSSPDGVLLSKNFHDKGDVNIGDEIQMTNKDGKQMSGTVYGFVDYWPGYVEKSYEVSGQETLNETDNYLIVANYSKARAAFGLIPYHIWIKNKDSSRYIYDYTADNDISLAEFEDVDNQLSDVRSDPLYQGTNGILTMSFIIILILCSTGFLIYWILSIRQRELLFGVFRAMGMTKKEIIQMLINEQIFSSGMSIAAGTVLGLLASKLFVPLVQIFYASMEQTVPLEVVRNMMDMIRLFSVIAFVIILCMVILGMLISKIRISQALKLGED